MIVLSLMVWLIKRGRFASPDREGSRSVSHSSSQIESLHQSAAVENTYYQLPTGRHLLGAPESGLLLATYEPHHSAAHHHLLGEVKCTEDMIDATALVVAAPGDDTKFHYVTTTA